MTEEFEREFARLHGCRFGIMCNSGTSALHLSLAAMKEMHGWQDGDEVIIPAIAFIADANVVVHNGMTPVLVDVDPLHYEINPELIEQAITPRTRAIIPVHAFGQPCDMNPILEISGRHGLKVIEDSAETMFARYDGKSAGSLGDVGCFSTYAAHLLTTGVGGIVTTNSPEYAVKIRSLMNHGRDSIYMNIDDDDDVSAAELEMVVERRFSFVSLGHSFRLTEMEAALGLAQLEDWEDMIQSRRRNAGILNDRLSAFGDEIQLPLIREHGEHSFMMYPIVLHHRRKREVVNALEQNGIETRDMLPLTNQPIYRHHLGFSEADFPVAKWVNSNGFYVGCHQDLKVSDLDYLAEILGNTLSSGDRKAPREGSELVLVSSDETDTAGIDLDTLPLEVFDSVIAVHIGERFDTPHPWTEKGIKVYTTRAENVYSLVSDSSNPSGENLVFFPLDGRVDTGDLPRILLALEQGFDMVTASRFMQGGARHDRESRFAYRSTGNRVFTLLANLLFYGNTTDALSQLRGIKRTSLKTLEMNEPGLGATYQMTIRAVRSGLRIQEIPTTEKARITGHESRKAWRSIFPLLGVLIREWKKARAEENEG